MNMSVSRNQSRLANEFAQEGNLAEALRAQRKAVALAPESDRYLFGLAEMYARAGSTPSALATLTLAIDRNSDYRARAADSDAFAGIRGNADFQRLVGGGR